ncbi:hypothetical protein [Mucilaginibacter sp. FT3.2]|uniref:hypothetical protein n=1 Tax=Mucilaginibacter sp. FT3.2 TaxID=2723090 RepID=UPI00161FA818|nr:hypothetical protein [Mucilaginibacter sp. FT3.2]MBB6232308.1 hypothetical protein [Mucilaginibacter sp. FT3.2]
MDIEEHVWQLATKKLANEASEDELRELDLLLLENPELKTSLILLFNWWQQEQPGGETNSHLLFERILKKIKPTDNLPNNINQ